MNYRERFIQIKNFLKPYQKIWENEIMLMYPTPLEGYKLDWIEDLRRFQDKKDVMRLEKKDVKDYILNPTLIDYYQTIDTLCDLPKSEVYPPMPEDRFTWLFIIPKKQHEIKRLAPHLNHLYQHHHIKNILDIGGGIGLLAQGLNNEYKLNVTSVDMNSELQKTGFARHEKNAKNILNKVKYKEVFVSQDENFTKLIDPYTMTVGLHTCGKLALDIIQVSSAQRTPVLVNFGCCYHTLHVNKDLQNISKFARESSSEAIWMNKYALTLACRAHKKMDEKDYDLKLKVKLFRYAIHILLHDHYGIKEIVTLGNSSPKLYDQSFGIYALEQFKRLNLSVVHSEKELNDFFRKKELQILIQRMLAAGLIRNALGRVLELYLTLDRAIYLEEQGYEVLVQEFFEEEVSPRNIGITATLKN
jgi:hypothetical protein